MNFLRRTPLKAKKGLNQIGLRTVRRYNSEVEARIALAERCGGKPILRKVRIRTNNGDTLEYTAVTCLGGICECGCGQPANGTSGLLAPHEKFPRGRGGKVSLQNSIMVLWGCHKKLNKLEPQWSSKK